MAQRTANLPVIRDLEMLHAQEQAVMQLRAQADTLWRRIEETSDATAGSRPGETARLIAYEELLHRRRSEEVRLSRQIEELRGFVAIARQPAGGQTAQAIADRLAGEIARAEQLLKVDHAEESERSLRLLDRVHAAVTHGRRPPKDSTEILREIREGRISDE